jgi:16S rRNA (guanine966-N2)-methyltransferase
VRIIAGLYRGRNLKSPPSLQIRPTSDRLRETLFNILAPRIEGARFLDLCAGTGAVGIEALSRGAAHVTFVDRSRKAGKLIQSNLELCRVPSDQTELVVCEASDSLKRAGDQNWDIAFFDPPYDSDYAPVLQAFGAGNLLTPDGLLAVEHRRKDEILDNAGSLQRYRLLKQGDSCLSFYALSV